MLCLHIPTPKNPLKIHFSRLSENFNTTTTPPSPPATPPPASHSKSTMRIIIKLIDLALFLFFLFTAIVAPLLDSQKVLPPEYYPNQLLDLNAWYANEYGDYLVSDNPHFFVGVIWNELLVLWPLAIANLVGIISSKSWFNTTCLIFGANCFGSMAAIMGELLYSGRSESEKLLMIYAPFMGVAALAVIRGLVTTSHQGASSSVGVRKRKNVYNKKKRP